VNSTITSCFPGVIKKFQQELETLYIQMNIAVKPKFPSIYSTIVKSLRYILKDNKGLISL